MSRTIDALYRLAERQAGHFTAAQAVDAGVSRRALANRAAHGDIERVRHGIYRLTRFPHHPFEEVAAACLWAGSDSVASHETALTIHGISDAMPATIHLTVPRPFRGHWQGVMIHHAPLPDQEHEVRDDVPVTTLERTLRDVASMSDPALVGQALEQAIRSGVLSRRHLSRLVRDVPAIAPLVVDILGAAE